MSDENTPGRKSIRDWDTKRIDIEKFPKHEQNAIDSVGTRVAGWPRSRTNRIVMAFAAYNLDQFEDFLSQWTLQNVENPPEAFNNYMERRKEE